MLAAKFVEAEIREWANTLDKESFREALPVLAGKIIEAYEFYRAAVGAKECVCKKPSIAQDLATPAARYLSAKEQEALHKALRRSTRPVEALSPKDCPPHDWRNRGAGPYCIKCDVRETPVELSPKFKSMNEQVEYNVGYSCPDLDQDFSDFAFKDFDPLLTDEDYKAYHDLYPNLSASRAEEIARLKNLGKSLKKQDLTEFDKKVHDSSPNCWCKPTEDEEGVWIHRYVGPA